MINSSASEKNLPKSNVIYLNPAENKENQLASISNTDDITQGRPFSIQDAKNIRSTADKTQTVFQDRLNKTEVSSYTIKPNRTSVITDSNLVIQKNSKTNQFTQNAASSVNPNVSQHIPLKQSSFHNNTVQPQELIKNEESAQVLMKGLDLEETSAKFSKVHPEHTYGRKTSTGTVSLALKPINQTQWMTQSFNKQKSCMFAEPVQFDIQNSDSSNLYAQKTSRVFKSQFRIFERKNDTKTFLGLLKSNFTGSIYNLYVGGNISCSIIFTKNTNHNTRECEIYLLNSNIQSSQTDILKDIKSLKDLYNDDQTQSIRNIIKFSTIRPTFSTQKNCYYLDFKESGNIIPSVKNQIFINNKGEPVLKFYKNTQSTYNAKFKHPLSWIIAYAYALVSTDFKIFTE